MYCLQYVLSIAIWIPGMGQEHGYIILYSFDCCLKLYAGLDIVITDFKSETDCVKCTHLKKNVYK